MAEESNTRLVDETSLSPIERRNSLEKHLQLRPDAQDLKNRNILLDTNAAPSLQAAQLELERKQATDSLRKGLEKRPDKEELVERKPPSLINTIMVNTHYATGNILPDTTAAPSLQEKQRELEKHMRADSLEHKIQQRPKPEDLIKEGILTADENPIKK